MTAPPILPLSASSTFPRTGNHSKKIEDFRPGYPRFTSLVSSHNPFFLFRRFSRLRARLLLIKQDKISVLEKKLDEIDESEKAPIFLGNCRMDRNLDRLTALSDIETSLAEFDDLVERTGRTLSFGPAEPRDTQSLRNWLDGNRCIARDEAAYLLYERDLFSLSPIVDSAATRLENWIEDRLAQLSSKFQFNTRCRDVSLDPNIHIYSGSTIKRIVRALLICLVTTLLLLPIVICNVVHGLPMRISVVMLSTVVYLLVLSGLTRVKTTELVVAGTTYATVLIVFVSGTGGRG